MRRMPIFLCALLAAGEAGAVSVRGRVDFYVPNGVFPMSGATVELCYVNSGCLVYRTGSDGMYYFPQAVPGTQFVRVNGKECWRGDIPNVASYDVPPVRGN